MTQPDDQLRPFSSDIAEEAPATHNLDGPASTQPPSPLEPTLDDTSIPPGRPRNGGSPRFPAVAGYEILSELGHGGMGVVYEARHHQLNRIVALKMVRSGAQAGSEDLRRFREEAEAVARMQHPNIVQIHEVGEIDGLPFFSLEYVDGGSLQKRMSKDTPIAARDAAALVETLARAMDYAHQRGIVHRDLKPGNVLLEGTGKQPASLVPKITDFGLAKQLEKDSGYSREGAVLGTPSYMAPEQAQGRHKEIGPAADIYALGAILYDLLVSRPPFRGETVLDTLQQVINAEPLPPRQLQPKLARDLEIVCLKCLEKEPGKRYASAGELADDLRRFLNNEPIRARATPWWEKGVKWAKRRPAAASLLFFALLTVAALLGGSMWFAAEKAEQARVEADLREQAEVARERAREMAEDERQQREKADAATRLAEAESHRANRRACDALLAVDNLLTRVSNLRLEHMPRLQPLRRALLTEALGFLNRFHSENSADPALREQLAFAQRQTGTILDDLGDRDGAARAYREALRLSEALMKADPDAMQHVLNTGIVADKLAITLQALAKNEADRKKAEEVFGSAVSHLENAHKQCLKSLGKKALPAAMVAAPLYPGLARWGAVSDIVLAETWRQLSDLTAYSLADTRIHRGNLHLQAKRLPQARADFEEAIRLLTVLHQDDPTNPDYRWRLGAAHGNLGINLYTSNPANVSEAVEQLDRALALLDPLVEDHPFSARYRADRAGVYRNRGVFRFVSAAQGTAGDAARKQAEADVKTSMQAFELLVLQYATAPDYPEQLADCHGKLALIQKAMNRPADALKSWNEAVKVLQELRKLHDTSAVQRKLAHSLDCRAGARARLPMPRLDDAAADWQESIEILEGLLKEEPLSPELWGLLLNAHFNRVVTWKTVGRIAEAERDMDPFVEALEERRNRLGAKAEYATDLASAYHDWGQLLRESGRAEEAETKVRRGIHFQQEAIKEKADDPVSRRMLCLYLLSLGDVKEAAEEVKNWAERIPGEKGRPQEAAWVLAQCAARTKDPFEAEMHARNTVELLRKAREAGFKDTKFLDKKPFDSLRVRDDFKEIVEMWK